MSLKHEFAKQGSLGFGAENFFSPRNTARTEISGPLLAQSNLNVQHLTSFKIHFSYRIGQLTAEPRAHKSVQNSDLKVDENGGGSQGSGAAPTATRPATSHQPDAHRPGGPSQSCPGNASAGGGPGQAASSKGLNHLQAEMQKAVWSELQTAFCISALPEAQAYEAALRSGPMGPIKLGRSSFLAMR